MLTTILIGAPKDQAAVSEASKKRLLELMENAPDITTYQEKAWVLLSARTTSTIPNEVSSTD